MNYYQILEVETTATAETIRQAYRKLVLKYHPDKNSSATAHEMFLRIQHAYEVLSNAEKRQAYDKGFETSYYLNTDKQKFVYFKVVCDIQQIQVFSAFKITYCYAGEGRMFAKPAFHNFFIAGKPAIKFEVKKIDGISFNETQIEFTLFAMQTGLIQILTASIKLNKQPFRTDKIFIQVIPNQCAFLKHLQANGKPAITTLMKAQHMRGAFIQTTTWHTFYALTPRSKTAMNMHGFALVIKYVTAICLLFLSSSFSLLITIPLSIIAGYLNEMIYYKLIGIDSMRNGVLKSSSVLNYLNNQCYLKNKIDIGQKWNKTIYNFESIFF